MRWLGRKLLSGCVMNIFQKNTFQLSAQAHESARFFGKVAFECEILMFDKERKERTFRKQTAMCKELSGGEWHPPGDSGLTLCCSIC